MNDFGYSTKLYEKPAELEKAAKGLPDSDAIIICVWNDEGDLQGGMHYIALYPQTAANGRIRLNPLNSDSDGYSFSSIDQFVKSLGDASLFSIMLVYNDSEKEQPGNV